MRGLLLIASVAATALAVGVTASGGVIPTRSTAAGAAFAGGEGAVWSPDGTQIAYIAPTRTANESGNLGLDHVVVVNADGSGAPRAVVKAPRDQILDEVRWGVGGHFIYNDSNYTLWTGTSGTAAKRITTLALTSGVGESFALSRDGREVAFTAPCNCAIPQGDTVGIVPVLGGKPRILVRETNVLAEYPSFSPDGKRVVFTRTLVGSSAPKYPANTALVVETLGTGAQRVIQTFGQWAAFSPDGRRIAFFGTRGLEVIPSSGGTPRTVLPFRYADGTASFSWSPNSQTLAYVTSTKVGTVDLSGHAATFAIPGLRPNLNTPQWSPDGTSIAFSAIKKGADLDLRVYLIDDDGAGLRRIA
jgi:Tol biopolymer transport system component